MNKTIFISAFNPFILRNILAGEVTKVLKENGVRMVVLVPEYKTEFFKKEIGSDNIIIEGVRIDQLSKFDIFFRYLSSSLVDTPTIAVNKHVQLDRDGRYPRFFISWILMKFFSQILFFKRLIRRLDYFIVKKDYCSKYFSQYQPQLVFATDIFNDMDVYLIAAAKFRSVKTVGMIRSWDNFTNKGVFRIKPDKLLVHNETLKSQALRWNDLDERNISVCGIPQYDRYFGHKRTDRGEFFKKIGLDSQRKLILFSPFGGRFTDTDWQIMEILKKFIENKEIPASQVLARFTPNDPVSLGNFSPDENFYIDRPGRGFEGRSVRDQELTDADMDWLADCLYHSDVIVTGGASIGIDAAIFGQPTILIHFDGFGKKPYWQSVERFLEYQHPRDIIKSGAMRSVKSVEELRQHLNNYLNQPELDRSARKKMILDQCYKLDGHSGERIGNFLLSLLY